MAINKQYPELPYGAIVTHITNRSQRMRVIAIEGHQGEGGPFTVTCEWVDSNGTPHTEPFNIDALVLDDKSNLPAFSMPRD